MMAKEMICLHDFIDEERANTPGSTGGFSDLMHRMVDAAKVVNHHIRNAGLLDIAGESGIENASGDKQQKLDKYADELFVAELKKARECCGVASEENDTEVVFDDDMSKEGKYVVTMDPLDGSSNIDVNVSVGTIFAIYKRLSELGQKPMSKDFLQAGNQLVASGYIIYGSSTMLVYSTGNGVNGFTWNSKEEMFFLSHPNMVFPSQDKYYSINHSDYKSFPDYLKEFVAWCQDNGEGKRRFSERYIGSLVADFHRNLLKGGVFVYPANANRSQGHLRLVYECIPIAFLAEQAGGFATNGLEDILDLQPKELHQRTPFFVGSKNMMDKIEELRD